MKLLIRDVERMKAIRPEGYFEEVLSKGTVEGEWISIPDQALLELRLKYAPRGLGDRVARLAKPIAGAIDAVLGTDLANCQGCLGRQERLNRMFPEGMQGGGKPSE